MQIFLLLYEISKSVTLTSRSYPGMGIMLSKTLDLYLPTYMIYTNINEIPQRVLMVYLYKHKHKKNFDLFMKILSL